MRVSGSSFVRVSRVTFGGVAGSSVHVLSKTSLLVTTPAHVPGTVDVRVTSSTGTSRVTSKDRFGFAEAPTRWSATMVAPSHYRPTSVSCASPSLCVAVDSFGSAFVHGDSGWTAPAKVEITGSLTSTALAAISCVPGTSWCLAVGDGGRADAYDGTNWKPKPVPGSPDLTGVSCASTTFCLAIGAERANEVYAFDGNAWAGVKASFDTQPFTSVSCASTELCASGSRSDSIDVYGANSGWAAPVAVGGAFSTRVDVLSCAAGTTFCMEIDDAGWARTSADGLTWTFKLRDDVPWGM